MKYCALLFLGWVVMYANRAAVPALLGLMGAEWGISRAQLGLISSAFFLAYTATQLPAGYLSDRWGPLRIIVGGQALQGAAGLGAAFSTGLLPFAVWRTLVGLGQGSYYSAQYALATSVLPPARRSTGLAVINSGMAAGTLMGLAVAGLLAYAWLWPWRSVLILLGGLGLVVTVLLARYLPVVPLARASAEGVRRGRAPRTLLHASGAAFTTMYGLYTLLSWMPYYLQEVVGLTGSSANLWASVVPAVAIPAGMAVGWWADQRNRYVVMLRLVPVAALACVLIAYPTLLSVGLGLFLYGVAGKMVFDPLLVAALADSVPASLRGRSFGILNLASSAAAGLAPALTGYLADATGSFVPGLLLAALAHVPAWFFVRRLQKEVTGDVEHAGIRRPISPHAG